MQLSQLPPISLQLFDCSAARLATVAHSVLGHVDNNYSVNEDSIDFGLCVLHFCVSGITQKGRGRFSMKFLGWITSVTKRNRPSFGNILMAKNNTAESIFLSSHD